MLRSWHGLFLVFSSTLTLLVMASMVLSSRLVREGADLVEHTNVVIGTLQELRAVVSEAESATRAYVIQAKTGNLPDQLTDAEKECARLVDKLMRLTEDNVEQQTLLQSLRLLVNQRLESLHELASTKTGAEGDQDRKTSLQKGSEIMHRLKDVINTGVLREQDLYRRRDDEVSREFQKQTVTSFGGLILAVATGLASLLFFRRSHREALRMLEVEQTSLRAQEADIQKSRFLANMSHEIRTPMNAILGFADLLSGMTTEARAQKYVASIQTSGRALLELINEVLDISRIEAGKLELRKEPTDVLDIVEGVAVMLKKTAADKGISLETKLTTAAPPLLETDPLRLRQIVLNLATNAVKFTHSGGVRMLLGCSPSGDQVWDVVITISDSGIGIAPEDHERIFSPFEQASPHSRSGAQGTGLGLSITQKLVEILGGSIHVTSAPGAGSEFTVTLCGLPASGRATPVPPTGTRVDFDQLRPATILVVDDNPTNRELIAGYFHGSSHELLFAQDGMEALELAGNAMPDVVLMDIRMPRMDGKWARQILHDDERTRAIPVIAQTASSMPEESAKLRQMFDGYLRKPFSPLQLFEQLEPLLGRMTKSHALARPAELVIPIDVIAALDATSTASWPALGPELNKLAAEDVPRLRETFPMVEIATFGRELQILAARHDCPPLNRYASALSAAAEAFEIEQVENLLGEFDKITSRVTTPASSTSDEGAKPEPV